MDKVVELPLNECDIKITVGRDGVWLQLGQYTNFHVANTLGGKSHVIGGNVLKWVSDREYQARKIADALPSQPPV